MTARDNPFSTVTTDHISYRFPGDDSLDRVIRRFASSRYRGAITGPKGHGKSTLLSQVASELKKRGFRTACFHLSESRRYLSIRDLLSLFLYDSGRIIVIDGAEQLPAPMWWLVRMLSLRSDGIIITTHAEKRLPSVINCQTSPALLTDLLNGVFHHAVDNRLRHRCHHQALALFERHNGNIRSVFRDLYDYCAGYDQTARDSA